MPELLNTVQAAELLLLKPQTLMVWRTKGVGPRYIKIGSRVGYDPHELSRWLAERTRQSTSDLVPAA